MAKLIKVDGTIKEVVPENGKAFSLKELQKFIGRNIQMIFLPSGRELVFNEEGKLDDLPENKEATKLWKEEYPIEKYPYNNNGLIVGNVLVVKKFSELGK